MKSNSPRGFIAILIAAVVSLVLALAIMAPALFGGRAPAFGDNVSFWAPSTAYFQARAANRELPLWNPHVLGGIPFAADINRGLFYPPNWLVLVMPAARALSVLLALHLALGAFGMYCFLSQRRIPVAFALWGGVVFAVSVSYLSLVNHLVMLESMAYLGLILWAACRLTTKPSVAGALVMAVFLALSALAGDVHATYIAVIAAGVIVGAECVERALSGALREGVLIAGLCVLSGVAALAIAAVAIVPAFELMRLTIRGEGGIDYAAYNGLDAAGALGIVLPVPWGSVRDGTAWNPRWSDAVYVGLPLVLLAAWGARRLSVRFGGVLLVLAGASLSFGALSPGWHLAYHTLPGFRYFRQPREYFIIAVVGLVLLAAHGLVDIFQAACAYGQRRGSGKGKRARARIILVLAIPSTVIVFAGVVIALYGAGHAEALAYSTVGVQLGSVAGACLAGAAGAALLSLGLSGVALSLKRLSLWVPVCPLLLAVVVAVDAGRASFGHLVFGPAELYRGEAAAAGPVRERLSQSAAPRFAPVGPDWGDFFEQYASRHVDDASAVALEDARRVKECLVDNEPMYAGLASAAGYSTFVLERYAKLYAVAAGNGQGSPVRLGGQDNADWGLLGAGAVLSFDEKWQQRQLRQTSAPPGIFMTYDWRLADSPFQAASLIMDDRSDVFSSPVIEGLPAQAPMPGRISPAHSIEGISRTPESLRLLVYTDEPGLLVVLENNYPGWRAYDNGVETAIYTANLTFRAIYLSAGRHEVEFEFRPASLYAGAAVSLAAVVALAIAAVAGVAAWRR